jgi:anti-sigma factor RsiW
VNLEGHSLDVLLFCYVDYELDADQRAAVEDLFSRNLAARQRVAEIRELNMLLKAAYNHNGRDNPAGGLRISEDSIS